MSRTVVLEDQERPLVWVEHAYPRETPRETGELLYDYIWIEHGFRQQTANDRCWTCDWPPCAPWHSTAPAPAIGPLRALVFAMFSAIAGVILTLVYLRGGL